MSLLDSLRPRPEFISLFREIVLDVWKQKQGDAERLMKACDEKITKLKKRKNLLVDALLYNRIDQRTYEEQLDKVNEESALIEIEQYEAKIEQLNIEGPLGFCRASAE